MIKELTTYIDTGTPLTLGTTLFGGFAEMDAPATCVIVEELDPSIADYLLTDMVQKPIRILSRSTSYWTARANAKTVFDLLHGKMQVTLPVITSGVTYCVNMSGTQPAYIGKDVNGRHVFVSTMMCKSQLI